MSSLLANLRGILDTGKFRVRQEADDTSFISDLRIPNTTLSKGHAGKSPICLCARALATCQNMGNASLASMNMMSRQRLKAWRNNAGTDGDLALYP